MVESGTLNVTLNERTLHYDLEWMLKEMLLSIQDYSYICLGRPTKGTKKIDLTKY
jgi:hypothetical protein